MLRYHDIKAIAEHGMDFDTALDRAARGRKAAARAERERIRNVELEATWVALRAEHDARVAAKLAALKVA